MKYGGKTDVGMKRKCNQDSFAVFSKDNYYGAVVCDGMGGAKGGNIASGIAVKTFVSIIKKTFAANNPDDYNETQIKCLLRMAVDTANYEIYKRAQMDEELEGMGTTLVAVLVCLAGAFAVNVGDSRVYAQTDGTLHQISTDHSFVQYLIDKGEIRPDEANVHPNKNIILRALGVSDNVQGDYFRIDRYDRILLCTDGLTNHVDNNRISEIISGSYMAKPPSYKQRVERLISEANQSGGLDNITAVLMG